MTADPLSVPIAALRSASLPKTNGPVATLTLHGCAPSGHHAAAVITSASKDFFIVAVRFATVAPENAKITLLQSATTATEGQWQTKRASYKTCIFRGKETLSIPRLIAEELRYYSII